jgi:alpha-amylase
MTIMFRVWEVVMRNRLLIGLIVLGVCLPLFACAPSQARLDAHATQVAWEIYTTLTAAPGTPTPLPTYTAAPPSTLTPTETDVPTIREVSPVAPLTGMPQGTDGFPWWNDSVFYEIFVRSFYDSDGDGIGDIQGIIQQLDYLNDGDPTTTTDLGITGIWLMPINPSPSYHGYDVTDYYDINPEYGTMDDFRNLLDQAHARGIRIIIDLVINHTSRLHPWFIQAGNPASPYHDWYIWSNNDPGYVGSWGQQVWFPNNGRFFYSTFSANMPDLNFNNVEVSAQIKDIAQFWLEEVGVDGFRLDAAKHLIEVGTIQANSAPTHDWWKAFRSFYKQISPQSMTVGEIWDDPYITAAYIQDEEFDLSFDFYLAHFFLEGLNDGNPEKINNQMALFYDLVPPGQFATFLTNHDQDRVMSLLFDQDQKAKAAASLLLTAPGVPFLYYGEEIGLQGESANNWNRRPMQWSGELNGGFSSGTPWTTLGPAWENYNVARQTNDPDSILSHYRDLIRIRAEHAALRVGDLTVVKGTESALYSILRVSDEEAVLVLINLSDEPLSGFWLTKSDSSLAEGVYFPVPIWGEGTFAPIAVNSNGGFFHLMETPVIPPYGTMILQLQPGVD